MTDAITKKLGQLQAKMPSHEVLCVMGDSRLSLIMYCNEVQALINLARAANELWLTGIVVKDYKQTDAADNLNKALKELGEL